MKYYLSKYNYFIEEQEKYYIYNLITGSITLLNKDLYQFLQNTDHYQFDKEINIQIFSLSLKEQLIQKGIIYDQIHDENKFLELEYNKDKFDNSYLSVIMLPVLQCNLDCHYCFEKDKNICITDQSIKTLELFYEKQSLHKKFITTRWSGGEPLLVWDKIRELSHVIINLCNKNHTLYSASLITNGTLLNENIINEMIDCSIKSLQITLDGAKQHHDKIRFYKSNKRGTFDKILNAIEIASQNIKILLRLNIDKNNLDTIDTLMSTLAQSNINKTNLQLFCKPVVCTLARTPDSVLFSDKEFYEVEQKLLRMAELYGLQYAFHWGIQGKHIRCSYNSYIGYYIAPDLKVYKCPFFVDTNEDHSVGRITKTGDMEINNYSEFYKGISYSPFNIPECSECKVLPICHGKCPVLWEYSGQRNEEGCIPEKLSIEEKIRYAIRNRNQMSALEKSGVN